MSFPIYNKYLNMGVEWLGEIPAHWEVRKIRRICQIQKRIAGELGHDVLSITQKGIKLKNLENNDGQISMDYSKYQLVNVGDFAMNHMDLLTGYVDISTLRGVTSPDYRVFTIKDHTTCYSKFLLYIFQICYKSKIFFAFGQGSSQLGRWRLPTDQFNDFSIPLPPAQEQKKISDFLDRETAIIDALILEQEKLIALLQEKWRTLISHAVTNGLSKKIMMKDSGIEWLGKIPSHWEILALKRDLTFLTSGSRGWAGNYSEFGALFLRIGNLTRDNISLDLSDIQRVEVPTDSEAERTKVVPGDVLISITAYLGSIAIVPEGIESAYVSQHIALARLSKKRIIPKWLGYVVLSNVGKTYLASQGYGGTKIQLSLEDVANIIVPTPSIQEQLHIVSFLDIEIRKFDLLISEAKRTIDLLKERRLTLISAAVTGKIDVRGLVPA